MDIPTNVGSVQVGVNTWFTPDSPENRRRFNVLKEQLKNGTLVTWRGPDLSAVTAAENRRLKKLQQESPSFKRWS